MEQAQKTWRVLELLKVSENLLKEKNIDNPRLNAELLLCDVLKEKRINLYLNFEKPLNEGEISEYRGKLRRRINHEPLQYILGYADFYGLRFKVTPDVLIPRPETEILVEKAVELISSFELINPKILEVGTGSGCISIAIANKVNCRIDAIDISDEALKIANENSNIHGTSSKITFIKKNILTEYKSFDDYNIILSNPPYIPVKEVETLQEEIKKHEPMSALTDDEGGLKFYRKIFELFNATSKKIKILLEIGDSKRNDVESLLKKHNIAEYNFYKDYSGTDRVLYINK
jgi:release factor glutamine methyltransferase